jgi:hypothetical protein
LVAASRRRLRSARSLHLRPSHPLRALWPPHLLRQRRLLRDRHRLGLVRR